MAAIDNGQILDVQKETERRKQVFQAYVNSEDYKARLLKRLQINDACSKTTEDGKEARALAWELCARPDNPAEGAIFFIENFGWTFDPRPQANPNHLPFILFDYQKEAIRDLVEHIIHGKDLMFEKSRDMGASWLIFVYVPLWFWLFRDGTNILVGSYKESLVDDRTKDSIMGMIDYALEGLPIWILPRGFNKDKHRNQMKLINPVNFNQITGDTMNPQFGRGKRKTAVLFDELGFWEYAKEAWEASSDVTACRVANSTPHGYNYFAMLRDSGIDVHRMHWKQHPLKDVQWYEFEKARRTQEEVAQELDISYVKSLEGRVYPEWNDENIEKGFFPYDRDLPLYVGWDFGRTDDTAIIWAQRTREGKLRIVDVYKNTNKHIEFFIPFITGMISMDMFSKYNYLPAEMKMIEEHRSWAPATHFGDPAGRFVTQASDHSVVDILRTHGIIVNFKDDWKGFQARKSAAKLLIMKGIELHKLEALQRLGTTRDGYFDMCMSQAAYPRVRKEGKYEIKNVQPEHNWTSHYRSAFEYLALGLAEYKGSNDVVYDKFPKKRAFNRSRTIGY